VAKKPVAKPIAKKSAAKPAPKKAVKPVAKKPVAKPAPKKAVKSVVKSVVKKVVKPVSKKIEKSVLKKNVVKPETKATKVSIKEDVKPVVVKPIKEKAVKPPKPAKPAKMYKPPKVVVKPAGIEKATTVIPMKQLPMKKKEEPVKEVKVPKTSVKTSVTYNPGYVPMEKRSSEQKHNNGEPIVRYSDTELNEFRDLINRKLDAAKRELAYLQGLITRKDEMGGDESDNRYMTMEDGGMSMEREQLSQMASRQITYIDHLEKAIMRIENKTYGICRVTGKLIDKARLRAVPHATLSLEAKLGLVKPGNE
jgi:RNA polymerase-binding transcription factor DksA